MEVAIAKRTIGRNASLVLVTAATALIVEPTLEYGWRGDVGAFHVFNFDIEHFLAMSILTYVAALVSFVADSRSRTFQLWPTLLAILLYPLLLVLVISLWAFWAGANY